MPLGYADDTAFMCYSVDAIKYGIKQVEEWSNKNKMIINKKKSGIMEIKHGGKLKLCLESSIEGYPIVKSYKFLGTTFGRRFTLEDHTKNIKKKCDYISHKLYPCLT